MAENLPLIEKCLEYYYRLGPNRSLLTLEEKSKVPFATLKDWCEGFGWDEKIIERDKDLNRQLEESYRSKTIQIRNRLVAQMDGLMNDMESCSLGLPFAVTCVADLKQLSQAYESLVRANILAQTKAQDLLGSDKSPKTWSDLLAHVEGDRPEELE
jgi:hypothetical protein